MSAILLTKKISSRWELIDICLNKCKERQIIAVEGSQKFKEIVLLESLNYTIHIDIIEDLAKYLGIPFCPPPRKYRTWIPTFCENLFCMKYYNPYIPKEYITIPKEKSSINPIKVLYHAPSGYQCIQYFNEYIPQINLVDNISNFRREMQPTYGPLRSPNRGLFSKHIGNPINSNYPQLDEQAVRAIHALIDVYVPYIEGICLKCFNVRFPEKGLGILYQKRDSEHDAIEVKISPPKPDSPWSQQRTIYITNTLYTCGQSVHISWNPWNSDEPIFTSISGDPFTHNPWTIHDQTSLNNYLVKEQKMAKLKEFLGTKKEIKLRLCNCK